MKKNFLLLALLSLLLASCSSSDKIEPNPGPGPGPNPDPGGDESLVSLTKNNLVGDWEQYYFEKELKTERVGSIPERKEVMRYPEADGFTVHFLPDNKYYESNAFGGVIVEGTYAIADNGHDVLFTFKEEGVTKTNKKYVKRITNMRLVNELKYDMLGTDVPVQITDTRSYRNDKMQGGNHGYPNAKEKITIAQLKGIWEITESNKWLDGVKQSDAKYKGNRFVFEDNNKLKVYDSKGNLDLDGTFTLVDDVIHYFFVESGETESRLMWVKNFGMKKENGKEVEGWMDYDKYMVADKAKGYVVFEQKN